MHCSYFETCSRGFFAELKQSLTVETMAVPKNHIQAYLCSNDCDGTKNDDCIGCAGGLETALFYLGAPFVGTTQMVFDYPGIVSIYPKKGMIETDVITTKRVTPSGNHALAVDLAIDGAQIRIAIIRWPKESGYWSWLQFLDCDSCTIDDEEHHKIQIFGASDNCYYKINEATKEKEKKSGTHVLNCNVSWVGEGEVPRVATTVHKPDSLFSQTFTNGTVAHATSMQREDGSRYILMVGGKPAFSEISEADSQKSQTCFMTKLTDSDDFSVVRTFKLLQPTDYSADGEETFRGCMNGSMTCNGNEDTITLIFGETRRIFIYQFSESTNQFGRETGVISQRYVSLADMNWISGPLRSNESKEDFAGIIVSDDLSHDWSQQQQKQLSIKNLIIGRNDNVFIFEVDDYYFGSSLVQLDLGTNKAVKICPFFGARDTDESKVSIYVRTPTRMKIRLWRVTTSWIESRLYDASISPLWESFKWLYVAMKKEKENPKCYMSTLTKDLADYIVKFLCYHSSVPIPFFGLYA